MKTYLILGAVLILAACQPKTQRSDWRGTARDGAYAESNLMKSWPESGPRLIWEADSIGNGYSSPAVSDQFVYTTGEEDSIGYLVKYDLEGKQLWKVAYGDEWTQNFPGSRGTPVVYDQEVYLCSGTGALVCFKAQTGELVWRKNLQADFGGVIPKFGYSQSPLVKNDQLVVVPGGPEHNVVALNRHNGELIWSCKAFGEWPAYNSAQFIQTEDEQLVSVFTAYHLLGIDWKSGELLWSHEQTNTKPEDRKQGNGDTHGNSVLFDNGQIYYSAGDGNGGVNLQLSPDGKSVAEKWQNPSFDSYMTGFVASNNHLYGAGHQKQQLMAIDCASGLVTDSLKTGRGITIWADGMIYFYADKGEMALIDPTGDQLKKVSSFKVKKGTKEHFAHPVIHDGVLYVRHGNYLGAYLIKAEG